MPGSLPTTVKHAVQEQDALGWTQFMRGCLSKKWEDAQEWWIIRNSTKWKRSSKKWLTKLIQAIWEVSREMWEHRNGILHHPLHSWTRKLAEDLAAQITREFEDYDPSHFLPLDQWLFCSSAEHMLTHHSRERQEQWIQSVTMARMRMTQTQTLVLTNSQLFMQNWLMQG